jgi:H+/gluconate symporter-like permease
MPSEDYYVERYNAHYKWMRYHGVITGLSVMTFVGLLWAWIFAIRAWQHRNKARKAKAEIDGDVI